MAHEGKNITRDMHGLPMENYNPDRGFQYRGFYGWPSIDQLYMATYEDNNVLYVNGSFEPSSQARKRYEAGRQKGMELLMRLRSGDISLAENETIKLVGYSMGGAYAAGMASVLMQDMDYRKRLQFVDYLAPYQPDGFVHPHDVPGRQYVALQDIIAKRGKKIQGIDELNLFLRDIDWKSAATSLGGHALNNQFYLFMQKCLSAGISITIVQ